MTFAPKRREQGTTICRSNALQQGWSVPPHSLSGGTERGRRVHSRMTITTVSTMLVCAMPTTEIHDVHNAAMPETTAVEAKLDDNSRSRKASAEASHKDHDP